MDCDNSSVFLTEPGWTVGSGGMLPIEPAGEDEISASTSRSNKTTSSDGSERVFSNNGNNSSTWRKICQRKIQTFQERFSDDHYEILLC